MGLDSKHPDYLKRQADWVMMRDFYEGERAVKEKTTTYLPATSGMIEDGMGSSATSIGQLAYDAYINRAVFPEYVKDAVEAYIGLLHLKDPTISLPKQLEPLREKATLNGESLKMLLRRINEEQLVSGRVGLLLDFPAGQRTGVVTPYIAFYAGETICNWDNGEIGEGLANLNLVVLNESGYERDAAFNWNPVSKYRVLMLGDLPAEDGEASGQFTYRFGVFKNTGGSPTFVESDMQQAVWMGKTIDTIPFTFVNTKDITAEPDVPPLVGLARLCKAIYCGEADLRQNLFMQGQDTLVISGERKKAVADAGVEAGPVRTGAGSLIELEQGGTAEYVGVTANGLAEQRQTLQDDRQRAESRSGQLINMRANGVESGDALKTRVAAQTATLVMIARTGAAALEYVLKVAARWIGANPDDVKVDPSLEFADYDMSGDNLVKLMTAIEMGAPLSLESVHNLMAEQGVTRMDFNTEMGLVKKEQEERRKLAEEAAAKEAALKTPGTPGSQTKPGGNDPGSKKSGIVPQK